MTATTSRRVLAAILLAGAATLPFWVGSGYGIFIATQFGVYLIVAMGLNVLAGYGGQTSLGHGAFVGLGAYTTALLMLNLHWPFWGAAAMGVVMSAVFGGLMTLPALRVSTWYLALITLGFGRLFEQLAVEMTWLTNGFNGLANIERPKLSDKVFSDAQLYWLVAAAALLCGLLVRNLVHSRLGRGLMAIRDNPEAATSSGVSVARLKLFAFMFSAALAGLGGALFAVQKTVITPDDFTVDFSIFFLIVVVLGGSGRIWGPFIGLCVFFLVPEFLTGLQSWRMIIYGVILLALMVFAPNGLMGAIEAGSRRLWARMASTRRSGADGGEGKPGDAAKAYDRSGFERTAGTPLVVAGVHKSFGGIVVLDGISLQVEAGSSHAIVGPNGSGKTTLLNLVSGFYPADSGAIVCGDDKLLALAPYQVARRGVGRTFQTPKLLNGASVLENVLLGTYGSERASIPEILLALPRARREAARLRERAMRSLAFAGMAGDAMHLAGEIPHGKQRLVEIARALVGKPRLLLLDEPAAGLSLSELDGLEHLITAIQELGATVVIVEHHLDLVTRACRTVTVLDQGRILAEGTPNGVFSNPEVLAAYMGRRPVEKGLN